MADASRHISLFPTTLLAAAKGAADDEEGWAFGLTAQEFWTAADTFLQAADSNACEALARSIVSQRRAAALTPLAEETSARENAADEQIFAFIGEQSGSHFMLPAQHVPRFNWTCSHLHRHPTPWLYRRHAGRGGHAGGGYCG